MGLLSFVNAVHEWIIGVILVLSAVSGFSTSTQADEIAEGRTYFVRYCASCHGLTADGRGPVAKVLQSPPTDLRRLGERYGMPLPADRIARFIDGRESVPAHGERDMPVWGERFHDIHAEGGAREAEIGARIAKIVAYLNSIQLRTQP